MATKIYAELNGIVSEIKIVSPTCLSATIESSKILEVARKLESMGFDHVKSVTAIDYLPPEPKMDIVYHISSFLNNELANFIFELQTSLDRQNPKIASVVDIWPSAEYPERETLDLMGVTFDGLPQKDRLFLMDNFEGGPPLRKDFKLKTEGIDA